MSASLPDVSEYPLPTLQQYLAGKAAKMPGGPAPYAVPMDRAIIERLSRSTLQYPVDRLVDLAVQVLLSPLLLNSIPVASRSFPRLNELRVQAAGTLGIPVPDLYAGQLGVPVGAIFTVGTDEQSFIFVETTYEHLAKREEMLFVIGHECGHIHNHHVTYRTLAFVLLEGGKSAALKREHPTMKAVADALELFVGTALAAWSRRAELTADRAGLICCRDLETSQRALVRLALGWASERDVEIDDYIRTMRDTPLSGAARFALMEESHPVIPIRLQALQLFHDSELYHEMTGLPRPDRTLLAREELEARVGELVALV